MCIIMVFKKDKPRLKDLKSAEMFNPDGNGISYIRKNKVYYHKGIDMEQIYKISKRENLPQIIHCRICTVGENSKELCHPFPISRYAETKTRGSTKHGVLFHNGHWSEWQDIGKKTIVNRGKDKLPNGQWSDSRMMAWIAHIHGKQFLELITGQKIAVMTPKGVKMYGNFEKDGKTIVSNKHHKVINNDWYYGTSMVMYDNDIDRFNLNLEKPSTIRQRFNKNKSLVWERTKKLGKRQRLNEELNKNLPIFPKKVSQLPIYDDMNHKIGYWRKDKDGVWQSFLFSDTLPEYLSANEYEEDWQNLNDDTSNYQEWMKRHTRQVEK